MGAIIPLSFGQQRLWFLDRLTPDTSLYNTLSVLKLSGALDARALQRSLSAVVARHESLRTLFVERHDTVSQLVQPPGEVGLPLLDLSADPGALDETVLRLRWQPFDLSRDLMLRASLIRLSPGEHVLVLAIHHIASDAWSLGVLYRDLAAFYRSFTTGVAADLPPLRWQYQDFALHQRSRLTSDLVDRQLSYWRRQLADLPATSPLPTDRPRTPAVGHAAGIERRPLGPALVAALRHTAGRARATFFMLLAAAAGVLLQRYGGLDDIVVGAPIAGRNQIETEDLIGFFVNTLVLRIDLSGDPTFAELLGRVRATALDAYSNQDIPFERLVEGLQPDRRATRLPLFQVMVEHAHVGELRLPGLTTVSLPSSPELAKFDLTIAVIERDAGCTIAAEYNRELFDPETIQRLLANLETLLTAVPALSGEPISRLPILSADEERLLNHWNPPPAYVRPADSLVDRFEAQVRRTPDAIAVVCDERHLTYGQLNAAANRLARTLQRRGAGPGTIVGLLAGRSLDVVIGLVGILKSGAAYLPLDPFYPPERLRVMAADAGLRLLVCASQHRGLLAGSAGIVCLDDDEQGHEEGGAGNLDTRIGPDELAYVIYTSGSTGTPKGVLVTHGNVVRLFDSTHPWFAFDARDVWTLFHSPSFDFSVWEIWGALLYGGRLIVVPYATSRSPEAVLALIERQRVTVLNQTPTAFQQLMHAERDGGRETATLRLVVFGGERLDVPALRPWYARHGKRVRLVNMYGITETTVHATCRPITIADLDRPGSPIGRPLPDLEIYLLDEHRRIVPIGVAGEIYVGGAGLARGYLNRPELTSDRFCAHPFRHGARLYRSGDRARYRPDGDLEFLGRADDQLKIRGFRIEPGEVESIIRRSPGVQDAAVAARVLAPGDERLVAYIVWRDRPDDATATLSASLAASLPDYMRPSMLVDVPALPLTPSGKVNRAALPAPNAARPAADTYVAPRTAVEGILADLWCELLRVDRAGIRDDFFDLGGHSLLAIQLVARIRDSFSVELPLRTIFDRSSLEELATAIAERNPGPTDIAHAAAAPLARRSVGA